MKCQLGLSWAQAPLGHARSAHRLGRISQAEVPAGHGSLLMSITAPVAPLWVWISLHVSIPQRSHVDLEKQRLFLGDVGTLRKGHEAIRCGDLRQVGQGESSSGGWIWNIVHLGVRHSSGAAWEGAMPERALLWERRPLSLWILRGCPHWSFFLALLQDVQRRNDELWDAIWGHHKLEDISRSLL